MRIQLIDVDGHNFPNLPLMKISAWHKGKGDSVEWYDPLTAWINPPDKVYMSKTWKIDRDNMIKEIADVLICIEMLKQMYMISEDKINKWIEKKQAK